MQLAQKGLIIESDLSWVNYIRMQKHPSDDYAIVINWLGDIWDSLEWNGSNEKVRLASNFNGTSSF